MYLKNALSKFVAFHKKKEREICLSLTFLTIRVVYQWLLFRCMYLLAKIQSRDIFYDKANFLVE